MKKILMLICIFNLLLTSCSFEQQLLEDGNQPDYEEYTLNEIETKENNQKSFDTKYNDFDNTKEEYILTESSYKLITYDDIKNFSESDFRIAINEIYARHGLIFMTEEYKKYFINKSWYEEKVTMDEFSDKVFNEFEKANLDFLIKCEKEFIYNNAKTRCIYKIYDGVYRDGRAWYIDEDDKGFVFYHLKISRISDYTFDFTIIEDRDGFNEKEIFPVSTAKYIGNGDMAVFYDGDIELKFTFPNNRESLPDIVQIKIDGIDFLEDIIFEFNGVPGREFS